MVDGSYCVELAPDMLTVLTEPKLVVPGEAVMLNRVQSNLQGELSYSSVTWLPL